MPLVVVTEMSWSATKVILTDTTGDYNASTNPTGYGSPNDEFSDFAHYALIRKKNVNGVDDEVLALDAYDPLTAEEFSATRSVDGWFEAKKFNIKIWDNGVAYTGGNASTGSVVYYNGTIYYCILSNTGYQPDLNPLRWTAVASLLTIENNPDCLRDTEGRVTPYNADVYWSRQKAINAQAGKCSQDIDDRTKKRLDDIYWQIQNVLVADQLGNNTSGEFCVLHLQKLGAK